MRHKFEHRKLNRTSEHRKALFKNMLNSLIKYEQITTTLPKAYELKPHIDKVITLGKKNSLQTKKSLFSKLQDKDSVKKLSKILSQRYEKRKGGYSRVIKAGFRYGDYAPMAIIELVDRNFDAKKIDIKKKIDVTKKETEKDKVRKQEIEKLRSEMTESSDIHYFKLLKFFLFWGTYSLFFCGRL